MLTPQGAPYRLTISTLDLAILYLVTALNENRFLTEKLMAGLVKTHVCYQGSYEEDEAVLVHNLVVQSDVVWKTTIPAAQAEDELLKTNNVTFWFDSVMWTPEVLTDRSIQSMENITCYTLRWPLYTRPLTSWKNEYGADSYISLNELTGCKQIELLPAEYSIKMETGQLYVKPLETFLYRSEYLKVDGKIRICVNYSGEIPRNLHSSCRRLISSWLTVFCQVIFIHVSSWYNK